MLLYTDESSAILDTCEQKEEQGKTTFLVRVNDDSMSDEKINEGDLLVADPDKPLHSEDLCVCIMKDYQMIIRRYYETKAAITLCPANKGYRATSIPKPSVATATTLYPITQITRKIY